MVRLMIVLIMALVLCYCSYQGVLTVQRDIEQMKQTIEQHYEVLEDLDR